MRVRLGEMIMMDKGDNGGGTDEKARRSITEWVTRTLVRRTGEADGWELTCGRRTDSGNRMTSRWTDEPGRCGTVLCCVVWSGGGVRG